MSGIVFQFSRSSSAFVLYGMRASAGARRRMAAAAARCGNRVFGDQPSRRVRYLTVLSDGGDVVLWLRWCRAERRRRVLGSPMMSAVTKARRNKPRNQSRRVPGEYLDAKRQSE